MNPNTSMNNEILAATANSACNPYPQPGGRETCVFTLARVYPGGFPEAPETVAARRLLHKEVDPEIPRRSRFSPRPGDRCPEICKGSEMADDGGGGDRPEVNFELMWTWFLPNPLWKSKWQ